MQETCEIGIEIARGIPQMRSELGTKICFCWNLTTLRTLGTADNVTDPNFDVNTN